MKFAGKIRVLHIITTTLVGGAERMLQKLVANMDRTEFESVVISIRPKGIVGKAIEETAATPVLSLKASGYPEAFLALPRLAVEIRRFRPDVIQGWMYHGNIAALLGSRLASSAASVLWSVRHSLQNLSGEKLLTSVMIRIGALLSRAASRVIYNSVVSVQQHAAIGYSRRNAVHIPNGFDTNSFRPADERDRNHVRKALGIEGNVFAFGMIARYDAIKGHSDFLKAAQICSGQAPEARYLLAGSGVDATNSALADQIRSVGLSHAVRLLGERNDVERVFPALDAVVLSSLSEGFPNVLGEAMACGVPCIATNVGECSRVMGDSGITVPPRNPVLLAKAMVCLQKEPGKVRRERGERARKRVRQLFSLEAVVRSYESLYRSVAGRN